MENVTIKPFKVQVTPEQSKEIQELLFKAGKDYPGRPSPGREGKEVLYLNHPCLVLDGDQDLTYREEINGSPDGNEDLLHPHEAIARIEKAIEDAKPLPLFERLKDLASAKKGELIAGRRTSKGGGMGVEKGRTFEVLVNCYKEGERPDLDSLWRPCTEEEYNEIRKANIRYSSLPEVFQLSPKTAYHYKEGEEGCTTYVRSTGKKGSSYAPRGIGTGGLIKEVSKEVFDKAVAAATLPEVFQLFPHAGYHYKEGEEHGTRHGLITGKTSRTSSSRGIGLNGGGGRTVSKEVFEAALYKKHLLQEANGYLYRTQLEEEKAEPGEKDGWEALVDYYDMERSPDEDNKRVLDHFAWEKPYLTASWTAGAVYRKAL